MKLTIESLREAYKRLQTEGLREPLNIVSVREYDLAVEILAIDPHAYVGTRPMIYFHAYRLGILNE